MFLDIIHRLVSILDCPVYGPEIGTSSTDWAQLSRFYLKTETKSSLRNVGRLLDKNKMDNVQKLTIYTPFG
jgi:hypothetical protein